MRPMDTRIIAKNLAKLVERDGRSMAAISKAAGLSATAIYDIVNGKSASPKHTTIDKISLALGVSIQDILAGSLPRLVPVVGYVGGGAMIYAIDDHAKGAGIDEVEPPYGMDAGAIVAVRIKGDSMNPLKDGWLLFYRKEQDGVPDECINKLCAVKCRDGRMLVKELKRGSKPHLFHLISYNAEPEFDVALEWGAKIMDIRQP